MGEFAPVTALGGAAIPIRPNAEQRTATVTPVASSSSGQGAQARMDTAPQTARPVHRERGDGGEKQASQARPKIDEFTLVGPTPAFQANVLELERDLQRAIERLESERGRVEADTAMKIKRAEARADAAVARADNAGSAPGASPETDVPAAETKAETPAPATPAAAPEAESPDVTKADDDG